MADDNSKLQAQLQAQLTHVQNDGLTPYINKEAGIKDTVEQLKAAGVNITPDNESKRQTPATSKPQAVREH
jgi:hypothetical protein